MKRWISIGGHIINPEYFNMFYIEEVPVFGDKTEWNIFGEDKNQVNWRFAECESYSIAHELLMIIKNELNI